MIRTLSAGSVPVCAGWTGIKLKDSVKAAQN